MGPRLLLVGNVLIGYRGDIASVLEFRLKVIFHKMTRTNMANFKIA